MKRSKWTSRLACALVVAGTVAGVALAAGTQGSQSDPLVTLSYLNEKAVPAILEQVDKKLEEREAELTKKLQTAAGEGSAAFTAVDAASGKTLTLSAGTQLLLRKGTASSSAALVDMTDGSTLTGDGSLAANHLYMAAADGQTVNVSAAATFLIQGAYSQS